MAEENNKESKITPILVVVLVIFAFFSGNLWTKVKNLEKDKKVEKQEVVQQPQQQAQEPQQPQVLGAEDQVEIVKGATAVKGPEDAKVTIVEFSEYQCPYCKKYVDDAYSQIMANYGDQVKYIFRDYPLPFHPHAQITAEAARCAGDQDKYWDFHDLVFANQAEWSILDDSQETLIGYATQLGLNQADFTACLQQGKFTQQIKDDLALGKKVGVSGTPSFFVNGQMLVGAQPYSVFEALIKQGLNK